MKSYFKLLFLIVLVCVLTNVKAADNVFPDSVSVVRDSALRSNGLLEYNGLQQKGKGKVRGWGGVFSFDLNGFKTTDKKFINDGSFSFEPFTSPNSESGWSSFMDPFTYVDLWTSIELMTPFINLKYQFDIPIHNTTGDQIRLSRFSMNFFMINSPKALMLPDLAYTRMDTRFASVKTIDIGALALLEYKRSDYRIGLSDRYVKDRFYYFSFSRFVDALSKMVRYTNVKAYLDDREDEMVESFFFVLPKPFLNLYADWNRHYKMTGGNWSLQEKNSDLFSTEWGFWFVHDFIFKKINMVMQPSFYLFFGNQIRMEGTLSLQYFF